MRFLRSEQLRRYGSDATKEVDQNSDLLGGWLPQEWWGDSAEPQLKGTRRLKAPADAGLKRKDERLRLREFRRRYYEVVAIVAADVKAKLDWRLPFGVALTGRVEGEGYFPTLCQTLYREMACKKVLCEPMAGEDLIERLIYWWAQGPLSPENLRAAMEGTSLQIDD